MAITHTDLERADSIPGNMKIVEVKRNIGLDLLRALSILYIVGFWHLLNYTKAVPHYMNFTTLRVTNIVLGVFVLLSGYFLGQPKNKVNRYSILAFYKKRLVRVYPLYLSALLLFVFFGLADVKTALKAAFLVSMFAMPAPPTLWFITVIMVFYLTAPLTIYYCRKENPTFRVAVYLTALLFGLFAYGYLAHILDVRIIIYLPCFVAGVYIANNPTRLNKYLLFILFALSILITTVKTTHVPTYWLLKTPMILCGAYICFQIGERINISSTIFSKVIRFLSYSSFCMFLFHRPIYITFKWLHFPATYFHQLAYLVGICLPSVIFLSYVIQKTYDFAIEKLISLPDGEPEKK